MSLTSRFAMWSRRLQRPRRRLEAVTVCLGTVVALLLWTGPAAGSGRIAAHPQKVDTVEAAIDYKRTLTELLDQLEAYLTTSKAALEKAKELRATGVVTETEVASHAASVDATTKKIAATRAKLAEVDTAITRLAGSPSKAPPLANRVSAAGIQSLDVPFDATVESLAPNYQGHLSATLAALLTIVETPKDEFETTVQYANRVRAKLPTGTLALQGQLTYGGAAITYDADRQVISLVVSARSTDSWTPAVDKYSSRSRSKLNFLRVSPSGYGDPELLLACRDIPGFQPDRLTFELKWSTEIDLSVDAARTLKPRLRVLFIGRVPAGIPLEELIVYRKFGEPLALAFGLEQIWLYDVTTGTVYAKGLINAAPATRE